MIKEYLKRCWVELAYSFLVIVFLFQLHDLNKVLISIESSDGAFKMLLYNDYEPIKYFICAIGLFSIGIYIIMRIYRTMRYEALEIDEFLTELLKIILVIFLLILILVFINNPILRAIMSAMALIGVMLALN